MDLLLMSGTVLCILFLTLLYRKTGAPGRCGADRPRTQSCRCPVPFRRISRWHCDFVILDVRSFTVKAIVELDDRTHLRPERQRRDAIFNVVVAQAGIPLLRPRSVKAADEVAEVIRRLA